MTTHVATTRLGSRFAVKAVAAPILLLIATLPSQLAAQVDVSGDSLLSDEIRELLVTPGDLALRESTLAEALFTIRDSWGLNVVFGDDVDGKVSGIFKQTPLHQILDALLRTRGYGYRIIGETLVVMKLEDVGQIKPLAKTAIIPLQLVSPSEVLDAVETLLSTSGKAHAIPAAKSLLVVDEPDRLALIREQIRKLDERAAQNQKAFATSNNVNDPGGAVDVQIEVAYYDLQHVEALDIREALEQQLSANGKVAAIEKENRIVVTDVPAHLAKIDEAINKLDVPRPQVRIRALIFDASLDDVERVGVNFGQGHHRNDARDNILIDSLTLVNPGPGTVNGAITLSSMSQNLNLQSVINMLQTSRNSRLLADPSVTVVDRDEASMDIVREIPFQQLTEGLEGGSIGTTSFREAGVKLKVIPKIANDGTISMVITPTFSVLAGFTEGDNQPIIDKREVSTTVRVSDGQTLVLGGLRQRDKVENYSGIPHLKDIKFLGLGHLFRSRNLTFRDTELLVFITPEVIGPKNFGTAREQQQYYQAYPQLRGVPANGDFSPLPPCGTHHNHVLHHQQPPLHGDSGYHQPDGPIEFIEELPADPTPKPTPATPEDSVPQPAAPYSQPKDAPLPRVRVVPDSAVSASKDSARIRWVPPVSPPAERYAAPRAQTPRAIQTAQPSGKIERLPSIQSRSYSNSRTRAQKSEPSHPRPIKKSSIREIFR